MKLTRKNLIIERYNDEFRLLIKSDNSGNYLHSLQYTLAEAMLHRDNLLINNNTTAIQSDTTSIIDRDSYFEIIASLTYHVLTSFTEKKSTTTLDFFSRKLNLIDALAEYDLLIHTIWYEE